MMKSKMSRILLMIWLGMTCLSAQASGQLSEGRRVRAMGSYSNLTGWGLGVDVRIYSQFHISLAGGMTLDNAYPLLGPPYPGNRFNGLLRVIYPWCGLVVGAGVYYGFFEITKDLEFQTKINKQVAAPVLSFGAVMPIAQGTLHVSLELGVAYGLPEILKNDESFSNDLTTYNVYAERKHASWGAFFPFFNLALLI